MIPAAPMSSRPRPPRSSDSNASQIGPVVSASSLPMMPGNTKTTGRGAAVPRSGTARAIGFVAFRSGSNPAGVPVVVSAATSCAALSLSEK